MRNPLPLILLLSLAIPPLQAQVPQSDTTPPPHATLGQLASLPDSADLLIAEAQRHLGKPYHFGGKGPRSFDCAGFARYVYGSLGFSLGNGSRTQYRQGRRITDTRKLQKGDLVFWQGREQNGLVGHTGIVCEVDTATGVFRFIHAATTGGVIYSYSTEQYYRRRYVGACRLLGDRPVPSDPLPEPTRRQRSRM